MRSPARESEVGGDPLTWLLESAEVSDERMNLYFDPFVPLCNFLLECLLPGCRWCKVHTIGWFRTGILPEG